MFEHDLNKVVYLDLPKTRVYLRPHQKEDLPFFRWALNNREISRFVSRNGPMTMEDEEEWYSRTCKKSQDRVNLSIVLKEGDKLIGSMGIHAIQPANRTAMTGSFIGYPELLGKGLGTEAKMLLLSDAFERLNLRQLYSSVFAFNPRSAAYALKCGYEQYATTPEHQFWEGKYHDILHFRITRNMWLPKWNTFKDTMGG